MTAEPQPRLLELLAPARDAATAVEAIRHGADAVYIGGPAFGARAAAGNSIDDIRRVAEYAHTFGAKVYVTLNTIVYEDELDDVRRLVCELDRAGADALIVQDMALCESQIGSLFSIQEFVLGLSRNSCLPFSSLLLRANSSTSFT